MKTITDYTQLAETLNNLCEREDIKIAVPLKNKELEIQNQSLYFNVNFLQLNSRQFFALSIKNNKIVVTFGSVKADYYNLFTVLITDYLNNLLDENNISINIPDHYYKKPESKTANINHNSVDKPVSTFIKVRDLTPEQRKQMSDEVRKRVEKNRMIRKQMIQMSDSVEKDLKRNGIIKSNIYIN